MKLKEKEFIKALEASFKAYKDYGPRSTAKLKKIHKYFADLLLGIWGNDFEVFYLGDKSLGDKTKEKKVDGKYYPKSIDITIAKNGKAVFCLGIKFATSNYKQNANNYFESMMGETANIQAIGNLPYAHLVILRQPTPYYKKNSKVPSKLEIINDHDIRKYSELIFENPQAHRPIAMAIPILEVDDNTMKICFSDLKDFSKHNISILKGKLSLQNLYKEIVEYRNYYLSKNQ